MIQIYGPALSGGSYILRIELSEALEIPFGRFNAGRPVHVEQATYAYVGSAMAQRGSSSLVTRLLRHATRRPPRPPHPIRDAIMTVFQAGSPESSPFKLQTGKRLHWHVDYLLDELEANLTGVLAIRSRQRLEMELAARLMADTECRPLAVGLGASDVPGQTHLLHVPDGADWWQALARMMKDKAGDREPCA